MKSTRKVEKAETTCGACGSIASIRKWNRNGVVSFYVHCDDCIRHTREYTDKRKAVSAWDYFNRSADAERLTNTGCKSRDVKSKETKQDFKQVNVHTRRDTVDNNLYHCGLCGSKVFMNRRCTQDNYYMRCSHPDCGDFMMGAATVAETRRMWNERMLSNKKVSRVGLSLSKIMDLAMPGQNIARKCRPLDVLTVVQPDDKVLQDKNGAISACDLDADDWVFAPFLMSFAEAFGLMKKGKILRRLNSGRMMYFNDDDIVHHNSGHSWGGVFFSVEDFNATDWYVSGKW